jgi:hypothetical protein
MNQHARFSPSSAAGWMHCAGFESSDRVSIHSATGTFGHAIAERCLNENANPAEFVGQVMTVDGFTITLDDELAEAIDRYVVFVRSIAGKRWIEVKLPIGHITGEVGAKGTADAIIVADKTLIVVDLKLGANPRHRIQAQGNEQLMLYALAAHDALALSYMIDQVRIVIVQPRIHHYSETTIALDELEAFRSLARPAADVTPGTKQCRWCARKATCKDLASAIFAEVSSEFDVQESITGDSLEESLVDKTFEPTEVRLQSLARHLGMVDLIEGWCTAVRTQALEQLKAGELIEGYKLVEGRRGLRQWSDPKAVQASLDAWGVHAQRYEQRSLVSPAGIEKLLKAKLIASHQWQDLERFIKRSAATPCVVPISDPRPPLSAGCINDCITQACEEDVMH